MYNLMELPFSYEEYQDRLKKVKAKMAEKNIDVLLITDPGNMYYLTGYYAKSFNIEQVVIVRLDDDMPMFIGRYQDAFSCAKKTTWLDEKHVFGYPDEYVQNETKHPMDWISNKLKEWGCGKKTIGVEIQHDYISPYAWERYKANLTEAKLVDGSFIVNWVRIVKSDAEIEFMRRAGKISEKMAKVFFEETAPGVRLSSVAAAIERVAIEGTEEFGGDYCASPLYFPRGILGGAPHVHWDDQPLPKNISMFLEASGCYRRYHAPFSRTLSLGKPADGFLRTADACIEGLETVIANTKAGMSCSEVSELFHNVLAKYGIEKEARIGYSIGIGYPPSWGEKTISLRPSNHHILEPNTCIHCLAALYYDNTGVSISQAMCITDTGVEKLYDIPFDVVVKE